jgi:hypothetical protein
MFLAAQHHQSQPSRSLTHAALPTPSDASLASSWSPEPFPAILSTLDGSLPPSSDFTMPSSDPCDLPVPATMSEDALIPFCRVDAGPALFQPPFDFSFLDEMPLFPTFADPFMPSLHPDNALQLDLNLESYHAQSSDLFDAPNSSLTIRVPVPSPHHAPHWFSSPPSLATPNPIISLPQHAPHSVLPDFHSLLYAADSPAGCLQLPLPYTPELARPQSPRFRVRQPVSALVEVSALRAFPPMGPQHAPLPPLHEDAQTPAPMKETRQVASSLPPSSPPPPLSSGPSSPAPCISSSPALPRSPVLSPRSLPALAENDVASVVEVTHEDVNPPPCDPSTRPCGLCDGGSYFPALSSSPLIAARAYIAAAALPSRADTLALAAASLLAAEAHTLDARFPPPSAHELALCARSALEAGLADAWAVELLADAAAADDGVATKLEPGIRENGDVDDTAVTAGMLRVWEETQEARNAELVALCHAGCACEMLLWEKMDKLDVKMEDDEEEAAQALLLLRANGYR